MNLEVLMAVFGTLLAVYVAIGLFVALATYIFCNPYGHMDSTEQFWQAGEVGSLWLYYLLRILYYCVTNWWDNRG
jgi:hypothetical protein